MEGGLQRGRNVGSVGGACRQDDSLGRWWETVPFLGLLLCLTMCGDGGAEHFCGLQPGFHIGQYAVDTRMLL